MRRLTPAGYVLLVVVPLLLLLLSLSGCLGPRPSPPADAAITPPSSWRAPSSASQTIPIDWWSQFHDPILTRLVEQALSHNAEIGEAAARVTEARADLRHAHAEQGPEIDFQGIGGYVRELEPTGPITTSGAETEGTISYDFDFFGRLASASKAARATLLASEASRDAVRLAIASTTAETYVSLLGYDRRLAIAEDTLKSRAASLKLEQRLAGAGYSSQLDLSQAEGEYRATEQLIPGAKLAVTQTENALSVLIGEAPEDITRNPNGLSLVTVPSIPSGMPSQLLRQRPDIFAAEETIVAADHSLDSARAAMLPDFALTGDAEKVFAAVLPSPASAFLIGSSVLAPIFDSGRRRAVAHGAAAKRDEAAYAYRDAVLQAFKEVENAVAAAGRVEEQREALRLQVNAEAASLKIATERYSAGYASYINQIDAERALLDAQLTLAQVETQRINAYVELYRALGGGWSAPDTKKVGG